MPVRRFFVQYWHHREQCRERGIGCGRVERHRIAIKAVNQLIGKLVVTGNNGISSFYENTSANLHAFP
jgi:hypothetical protein